MGRLRNNIKIARKSVFYDFRAYVWFFFAVFLIQVFLSSALLSLFNADNASHAVGEGEYNYHIALKNINSDQRLLIENDRSTRFESGKFYDIQDVVVHEGNADRFDVYLTFRGDISASYSRFLSYYSEQLRQYGGGAGWYVSTVPELSDNASAGAGALKSVVVISAASFLCVLFLTALYSIRADYFKFSYGIFMTYGGGSKKIFSTSFYEMAVIALVCAIPSSVFSRILTGIIYSAAGFDFKASFSAYVISILLSIILSAAALYTPCKRISRKTPVENLRAEDNSNYVTSPRVSFEFWKVNIPFKYGAVSMFRFRKYYARIILFSVLFASVFVWTVQSADVYYSYVTREEPDMVITFDDGSGKPEENEEEREGTDTSSANEGEGKANSFFYTDQIDAGICGLEGISYIHRAVDVQAESVGSFAVIESGKLGYKKYSVGLTDGQRAFSNAVYSPLSENEKEYLERFNHSGDIDSAARDNNSIIVCDTVFGERGIDIAPGDKITIASFIIQRRYIDPTLAGTKLLERQLRANEYNYKEYTVGAVLHDMPGGGDFRIYIPEEDLLAMCGPEYTNCRRVEIGLEEDVSKAFASKLEAKIADLLAPYPNASVKSSDLSAYRLTELSKNIGPTLLIAALTALLAIPPVWLFSQRMFSNKRRDELFVLKYIGITDKKIRGILAFECAFAGVFAAILFPAAAYAGGYIIRYVASRAFSDALPYGAPLPSGWTVAAGALVIAVCAFLSYVISYKSFIKKSGLKDKININAGFGE